MTGENDVTSLNDAHPDFKLTYELALIEHLGLNLYSEPEAALSELIANAYDADSAGVVVTLPIGVQLGLAGQTITVQDTGHGMTYEEARDHFLRIGRNRRRSSTKSRSGARSVIGKKGIGKLAGFGIASEITVSTVAHGRHTLFTLNFEALKVAPVVAGKDHVDGHEDAGADAVREYKPELEKLEEATDLPDGTTITLRQLRPLDAIDLDDFKARLARRFAVFGDKFRVELVVAASGERHSLSRFDVPCQFRFPENGWGAEEIMTPSGRQRVEYWVGFTRATIKADAERGISVLANGKSIQEPFDFRLTGGTTGQFGLQYMTGEVVADWIDNDAVDVIASDRASVRWSDPNAAALMKWGQRKVKDLLEEWGKRRARKTVEAIKASRPDVYRQIESYRGEARAELERVVDRVVSTMSSLGEERTEEVVASIVGAFSHEHVQNVLRKVKDSADGLDLFVQALAEWDAIDAVLTFQDLSVKLEAVKTLAVLVEGGATEVKSKSGNLSLSEHLAANPWLLDPGFKEMQHELSIRNFIWEHYGLKPKGIDKERADFIALYSSERVKLIEIKSADAAVDLRGLNNFIRYKDAIEQGESQRADRRKVEAVLIYGGKRAPDAEALFRQVIDSAGYHAYTWRELLERNVMIYKEQLTRVRERNPSDPRIAALWRLYEGRGGPAVGRKARDSRKKAARKK